MEACSRRACVHRRGTCRRHRRPGPRRPRLGELLAALFEDEASFWLDGTLHQTWSRKGVQPRVDTYGLRKTAHIFGAITVEEEPQFTFQFSDVFNGHTFHQFLELVAQHRGRKVFLIIDNGPCHWLDEAGKAWLAENGDKIELHRLPPYSPELRSAMTRSVQHSAPSGNAQR